MKGLGQMAFCSRDASGQGNSSSPGDGAPGSGPRGLRPQVAIVEDDLMVARLWIRSRTRYAVVGIYARAETALCQDHPIDRYRPMTSISTAVLDCFARPPAASRKLFRILFISAYPFGDPAQVDEAFPGGRCAKPLSRRY